MKLAVHIGDEVYQIDVPHDMLDEAQSFFEKMDRDMDAGWQMSREFVENPNLTERCQIVADKLYTAIETENRGLAQLMAGYILSRMPGVVEVDVDTSGEMQGTEFTVSATAGQSAPHPRSGALSKLDALEQAGKDVGKVYRVGSSYRYAVYDHDQGEWIESSLFDSEQDADASRMRAFTERYEDLLRGGRS